MSSSDALASTQSDVLPPDRSPYAPDRAPDPRFPVTEDFALVACCLGCGAEALHDHQPTLEEAIRVAKTRLPAVLARHAGHVPGLYYVIAHRGVWITTVANP